MKGSALKGAVNGLPATFAAYLPRKPRLTELLFAGQTSKSRCNQGGRSCSVDCNEGPREERARSGAHRQGNEMGARSEIVSWRCTRFPNRPEANHGTAQWPHHLAMQTVTDTVPELRQGTRGANPWLLSSRAELLAAHRSDRGNVCSSMYRFSHCSAPKPAGSVCPLNPVLKLKGGIKLKYTAMSPDAGLQTLRVS